MKIIISNSSPDPIYEQIGSQIRNLIIKGDLQPGEMLPSIRSLARELQVSVITSKRAYEELERDGYIESVAVKGSFVAAQNPELLREKRMSIVEKKLSEVIQESKLLDISREELHRMLDLLHEEV